MDFLDGNGRARRAALTLLTGLVMTMTLLLGWPPPSALAADQAASTATPSPAARGAMDYIKAVSQADAAAVANLDFACLYEQLHADTATPSAGDATETCLDGLRARHAEAIMPKVTVMHAQWPGHGRTVFFSRPLSEYPVSTFAMELLGQSPPGTGVEVTYQSEQALPEASFPSRDGSQTVMVPTSLVRLTLSYKDPLSAPLAHATGTSQWTTTVDRPRVVMRAISLQFVVFTGLRQHGFPSDVAVLNRHISTIERTEAGVRQAIPFVTETSHAIDASLVAWQPNEMPGLLISAVARSQHYPDLEDRMAMLNRVLLLDPQQPDALTTLTRDLYLRTLTAGEAALPKVTSDPSLARRLSELSWNHYAQTTRMDLSLGMDLGGFAEPTAADYLYRMIPAMEQLAEVRPMNLDNRLYLGIAYRWNLDQWKAINMHADLVRDLAEARKDQQARALLELAWSRIAKTAWNREIDDPDIHKAYAEAERAQQMTGDPLDKFLAYYAMAYSQIFMPERDTKLMFTNLSEAKRWFEQTAGATPLAWDFVISRETLKSVLDADPTFQPLMASTQSNPTR